MWHIKATSKFKLSYRMLLIHNFKVFEYSFTKINISLTINVSIYIYINVYNRELHSNYIILQVYSYVRLYLNECLHITIISTIFCSLSISYNSYYIFYISL